MTGLDVDALHLPPHAPSRRTRLAVASRGDALTPYLLGALERRFSVVGSIDPDLTQMQRYSVAAMTVRPTRSAWAERFYKSVTARRLRSENAVRQLDRLPEAPDAVFQVHQLFDVPTVPTVSYIDCTHRQSAEHWAPWNPLRGRALASWYRRELESYRSAAHLFAFSHPTRDSLIHDYGVDPERITVTGAGVNAHALPDLHERETQEHRPPTVLFIGNDFVRKGGLLLLEAFRAVRAVLPDARLRLVGTLPPIPAQDGVEIVGRVRDRALVTRFYREADVFALPSYFDPYPLVTLEAMAAGVPVVTSRQQGTPEMIQDGVTGRLIAPGAVDELAEALLEVLQDDVLASRLRDAARADVEARFTWDSVVARMGDAIDTLSPRR